MHTLIDRIIAELTPNLLKTAYRDLPGGPTAGHCYHAAEALWHAMGGRDSGYVPHVARDESGCTHWWLEGPAGRLDPTSAQYESRGCVPPYAKGRGCGFLTTLPSRRARIVLARIGILC